MAGLMNHEPENHYDFMIESLNKVCWISYYLFVWLSVLLDEKSEITSSMGYIH